MASLSRKEVEDFIVMVTQLRDQAYELSLEHSGAIKAAQHFLSKLDEAEQSSDAGKGAEFSPPTQTPPPATGE